MKIEKLTKYSRGLFESDLNLMFEKINELIDAFNEIQHQMCKDALNSINTKEKEPEILGCPFCGQVPEILHEDDDDGFFIDCENENCGSYGTKPSRIAAINAWNARK